MASKADRFYFENFIQAADSSCKAARYLVECLSSFEAENLSEMLDAMHAIEHEGDEKKHAMSEALAKAFVTPVDREDLAMLSHQLDDVTDTIEDVLQCFYKDCVTSVTPQAILFSEKIETCCQLVKSIMEEFINFKKPAALHKLVVELNHVEEECDKLYLDAMRDARTAFPDVLDVISWREIYDCMEECVDACEHVGDCVETVVMKNT